MKKIAIIGGPSSGKTTTALLLCYCLKMMGREVHFLLEYATNYIIRNGEPKNVFEQLAIFHGQKDEEGYVETYDRKKGGGIDYLICDCATLLAGVYARQYAPKAGASEEEIHKYHFALKTLDKWARERTLASYDFIFFLPPAIPFKKNIIRWQSEKKEAVKISEQIEGYLKIESQQYHVITGSPEERVKNIIEILKNSEQKEKNPKIFPLFE